MIMITMFPWSCQGVQDRNDAESGAMAGVTLREQNKTDKLNRIKLAARHLFGTKGFDATSTREIATLARVGLATLFLYAQDKRDLLFLSGNDDLAALTDEAFADVDYSRPLLEQLVEIFRHFFEFYARDRLFARDLLRELTFYTSGEQSARFQATRQFTISSVERVVQEARRRGSIHSTSPDSAIAEVIFYVFAADVRRWLGQEQASIVSGLEHLRTLLTVVLSGL
jgi:AcrR family transcriptional regulator